MLVLGATGWVRRAMQAVPMPIVMGMVAGVFLRFGLDLVRALQQDLGDRRPDGAGVLWLTAVAGAGPAPAAADRGAAGRVRLRCVLLGRFDDGVLAQLCNWHGRCCRAAVVLGGDGRIGGAAGDHRAGGAERPGLRGAARRPGTSRRSTAITVACGAGALLSAVVGSVSTCLTGPTNAILTAVGRAAAHYTAGIAPACWPWCSACCHRPSRA